MAANRGWLISVRLLAVLLVLETTPLAAGAQPPTGRIPRIGLLGVTSVADYGWADGRYDQLSALAAELIRLQPDVIITSGPGTRVLKEATTTIPIVMAVAADVVATGLVESLARPVGNVTGSTVFGPELSAKRFELLKAALPRLARAAVLLNPDSRGTAWISTLWRHVRAPGWLLQSLPRPRALGDLDRELAWTSVV